MTPELQLLLELYSALQDRPPTEEAARQEEFARAVKAVAAAKNLSHWRVSAHVVQQFDVLCQREQKRKGLDKGAGL